MIKNKIRKNHKASMDISFGWIFAIIAGAFILFLAIFAVTKFMGMENTSKDAEAAKTIGVLLNPLETSFESGRTSYFTTSANTRIYPGCKTDNSYGTQRISVSQEVYGKWSETDIDVSFPNKFIFSKNVLEGKKFYLFSKPFNFPFKVSDLIYMTSANDNYCFIGAEDHIEEEIENLGQPNIYYKSEEFPEDCLRICFGSGSHCDINVYYEQKFVRKDGKNLRFTDDSLMYAAIFSDETIYECQLKRLMYKTSKLSELYGEKSNLLTLKVGCSPELRGELIIFESNTRAYQSSDYLNSLNSIVEDLQNKNEYSECPLW